MQEFISHEFSKGDFLTFERYGSCRAVTGRVTQSGMGSGWRRAVLDVDGMEYRFLHYGFGWTLDGEAGMWALTEWRAA